MATSQQQPELEPIFTPTAKQLEVGAHWFDPDVKVVTFGGAIRSGKTQAAGLLFAETAIEQPSTYLVARYTYRELKDSTQRAMLYGDGALPPLIPPSAIREYRASDEAVFLTNGSRILFRSLDDPAKLLNLTLGGVFIDQIEELDEGPEGERVFDTLLGRLSDPGGPRKLIAVANPGSLTHWVFRRLVNPKTRDHNVRYVHVELTDNAANLPADYVESMLATEKTRPHWFKSFIKGQWGSFEGAAYEEFDPEVHVVQPFVVPQSWERFESADYGVANPTAWLAWAVDYDGNIVGFDEYYSPGQVSLHATEISRRQFPRYAGAAPSGLNWWRRAPDGRYEEHLCFIDPSIRSNSGLSKKGQPATVWTEFEEHGIEWLAKANNDRAAGYARVLELVHLDDRRPFPSWHPRSGQYGAPRLYLFTSCENLVAQIQSAPVAEDGVNVGRAVDEQWERAHGHAHAALRYGMLTWPDPTPQPDPLSKLDYAAFLRRKLLMTHEQRMASGEAMRPRLIDA